MYSECAKPKPSATQIAKFIQLFDNVEYLCYLRPGRAYIYLLEKDVAISHFLQEHFSRIAMLSGFRAKTYRGVQSIPDRF